MGTLHGKDLNSTASTETAIGTEKTSVLESVSHCPIPSAALNTAAIIASRSQHSSIDDPMLSVATAPSPVALPPPQLLTSSETQHHPSTFTAQGLSVSTPSSLSQAHTKQTQQFQPMKQRPSLYRLPSTQSSLLSSLPSPQKTTTMTTTAEIAITVSGTNVDAENPTSRISAAASTSTSTSTSTCATNATSTINPSNSNKKDNFILRAGKWTPEEENYANILIELFEAGEVDEYDQYNNESNDHNNNISSSGSSAVTRESQDQNQKMIQTYQSLKTPITNGMTLRSYLSRKLFCSPMRISKKFAGKGIGKRVYMSQNPNLMYHHRNFQLNSSRQFQPEGMINAVAGTRDFPFQQPLAVSSLQSSSSSSSFSKGKHWNKMNRLKQAESDFLKVAFPNGDPMDAYKRKKIHPALLKAVTIPVAPSQSTTFMPMEGKKSAQTNKVLQHPFMPHSLQYQHQHYIQSSSGLKQNKYQQQRTFSDCISSKNESHNCEGESDTYYDGLSHRSCHHSQQQKPFPPLAKPQAHNFQNEAPSKIQKLKEAYFNSVSTRNQETTSEDVCTRNEHISTKSNNLRTQQQQHLIASKRNTKDEYATAPTDMERKRVLDRANRQVKDLSKKHSFDINQTTGMDTTKSPTRIPNFLSGFDSIYKKQHLDRNAITNHDDTAEFGSDLYISAQYSPAYYTSKSFDDFHRYLGKGLSPATAPQPVIPLLLSQSNHHDYVRKSNPVIPPLITSSEEAPASILQMRPRGRQDKSLSRKRRGMEASIKAIQSPTAQESTGQHAKYAEGRKPEKVHQYHYKHDETEFPVEGMKFEDFGTLGSYPEFNETAAIVSEGDETQSECSCRKRKHCDRDNC